MFRDTIFWNGQGIPERTGAPDATSNPEGTLSGR